MENFEIFKKNNKDIFEKSPIDLHEILKRLNIDLYKDMSNKNKFIGCIKYNNDLKKYQIFISNKIINNRLIIANLLSVYFLDNDKIISSKNGFCITNILNADYINNNLLFMKINSLTLSILTPIELIFEKIIHYNHSKLFIDDLASIFSIPEKLMYTRLYNLGIIDHEE